MARHDKKRTVEIDRYIASVRHQLLSRRLRRKTLAMPRMVWGINRLFEAHDLAVALVQAQRLAILMDVAKEAGLSSSEVHAFLSNRNCGGTAACRIA